MENPFETNETKSQFDSFELQLNTIALESLRSSASWSMFLAIMGFIGIGFMVLGAIAMTMMGSAFGGAIGGLGGMQNWFGVIYIIIAALYFMPVYYLYKYSSDMKTALNNKNSELLSSSLGYLKSHHKFLGISIIAFILLYIVMIVGFFIVGVSNFI